ncbi:hypothetical protein D3C71_551720 [compost metagenome]
MIDQLSVELYNNSPHNRTRSNFVDYREKINDLSNEQKVNLLVFSFQNYDYDYNYELCLAFPQLWNSFKLNDWEILILKMFPRKVQYVENDLRNSRTGCFFDVALLNGIIDVPFFDIIFESVQISAEEKRNFYLFVKFHHRLYWNIERQIIEDVVAFYDTGIFEDIVKMKEEIIFSGVFHELYGFEEFCSKFKSFD